MTKQIFIADRQYLTREAVRKLIQKENPTVEIEAFDNPDELWENNALFSDVEVVFLQVEDRDVVKMENILKIQEQYPVRFILLTEDIQPESAKKLFELGLKHIITKNCSEEEILNAYKSTETGMRFYCNTVLDLFASKNKKSDDCDPTLLTPREFEVLEYITRGKKTNEIADILCLSVHTINSHRKNILKKLNLKSPTELILYAIDSGLVKN